MYETSLPSGIRLQNGVIKYDHKVMCADGKFQTNLQRKKTF